MVQGILIEYFYFLSDHESNKGFLTKLQDLNCHDKFLGKKNECKVRNYHLRISILEVCVEQIEFFEWPMCFFIWLGVVVASRAFLFNVIEKVFVSMCFREVPRLGLRKALLMFLKIIHENPNAQS